MACLSAGDLDEYTRFAVPLILARFPDWEPFGAAQAPADGTGGAVGFNVPCPSPAAATGLWVSTAGDELSVGFDTYHSHFTDDDDPLNPEVLAAGLDQAAAYLDDRSGVVSWYQGARLVGSMSCDLPLSGPLPRMFSPSFAARGTLRSWSGRHDRDEPSAGPPTEPPAAV